jgi:4-hydroxybenzoate polyprenyltransferase
MEKNRNDQNFHNKLLRPLDFIFFMRPVILVPLWSFILIGYFHSSSIISLDIFFQRGIPFMLVIKAFLSTLIMGIIYIINQIYDRETDALNKKLFFIPSGIVTVKQAKIQIYVLIFIFILGNIYFKLDWYFIFFNILLLILGICYSMPPLQFKSRPGLDILVNTIGYGWLAFFIGWTIYKPVSNEMWIHSLPYFVFMAAVYINTTLIDLEGDKDSGILTTGIFMGKKIASYISLLITVFTIFSGVLLKDWIIVSIVAVSLPLFIAASLKRNRTTFLLSVQIPGWIFVVALGIIYPWFLLFIIFIYLLTKFYYKYRFNMDYPRLGEEKNSR